MYMYMYNDGVCLCGYWLIVGQPGGFDLYIVCESIAARVPVYIYTVRN